MDPASAAPRASGGKINVLVVEDRPLARKLLGAELGDAAGVHVIGEARHGREGVDMVRRLGPDIVLMDLEMPEMDGLTATHEIRKFSDVPIIMLTGSHQNADTLEHLAKKRGADAFVLKPSGSVSADLYKIKDELMAHIHRLTLGS